ARLCASFLFGCVCVCARFFDPWSATITATTVVRCVDGDHQPAAICAATGSITPMSTLVARPISAITSRYFCVLTLSFISLLEPLVYANKLIESYGCDSSDHRACDEICKQDSFWYGHCITWDGRDFSCKCHEYRPPLDKTPCLERQQSCSDGCKEQGLEGGYCYIHTVPDIETGAADCKCFDEIPIDR
uniref:Uncharacterized protein n=1 Tax=Parascaris univalens TaxID=6257 RepID=A0A915B7S6_PARUN